MGVSRYDYLKEFTDSCGFLEYFQGWLWVSVTTENIFMSACTFLEYIYGRMWLFMTV